MIIALMVCWVVAGLLLALLVGGAVHIAEARSDRTLQVRTLDVASAEPEVARRLSRAATGDC